MNKRIHQIISQIQSREESTDEGDIVVACLSRRKGVPRNN